MTSAHFVAIIRAAIEAVKDKTGEQMIEYSTKATVIIVIVVFAVIISIPILMYNMKFEVDEKSVWFSREGIPHCPYCFRIVEPHTGYCLRCENHFRWMDKHVVCWHCGGQKNCPVCKGSGYYPNWYVPGEEQCYNCFGKGICQHCLPESEQSLYDKEGRPLKLGRDFGGFNIFGGSSIRHPFQRK